MDWLILTTLELFRAVAGVNFATLARAQSLTAASTISLLQ